ncbi:MAG: serine/threonine-protein phosphatase [Bacteroidetes bacterium]|nr:serine/threonine-protein phosphatase [Bacteroidota bacterium]
MEQRKVLKIIESLASKPLISFRELLSEVVTEIVNNDQINVTGGRVWKLDAENKGYRLLFQTGNLQRIEDNFLLPLIENPIFEVLTRERTILADETNEELIKRGIFKYSASGVGNKTKVDGKNFYQYLLAVNSDLIDDELRYTLNIVATVLTQKLKERNLSVKQKTLVADIDKAKALIKSILPEHEYSFHGYDLFGITLPAEYLAGDFFDYVKIGNNEERLGIVVGDAASKGLSAAAEAMYISGAVRMASIFQIKISPFMYRVNQLVNKIFSDDRFCSLFYGEISADKKGLFLYANAGHNPPIFISSKDKKISYLEATGPLLGPAPNSKFETDSINFSKGDVLLIYSDGITEAANDKFEFFEEQRLEKLLIDNIDLSPREIVYKILESVNTFSTDNSKYQDDKTLVVVKRKG